MYQYRIMVTGESYMPGKPGRACMSSLGTDETLRMAADALGWRGVVLPQVSLFGTRASMVVAFDQDAHSERQRTGTAHPVMDADVLAMWEWPQGEGVFPPSPVSIVGV